MIDGSLTRGVGSYGFIATFFGKNKGDCGTALGNFGLRDSASRVVADDDMRCAPTRLCFGLWHNYFNFSRFVNP